MTTKAYVAPCEAWSQIQEQSKAFNESADCAVKSLAVATGVDYSEAHSVMKKCGRKDRQRTPRRVLLKAVTKLGFTPVDVTEHYTARTIVSLDRETTSRDNLIVSVAGHSVGVSGGKVIDWSKGSRKRIRSILRIVKRINKCRQKDSK